MYTPCDTRLNLVPDLVERLPSSVRMPHLDFVVPSNEDSILLDQPDPIAVEDMLPIIPEGTPLEPRLNQLLPRPGQPKGRQVQSVDQRLESGSFLQETPFDNQWTSLKSRVVCGRVKQFQDLVALISLVHIEAVPTLGVKVTGYCGLSRTSLPPQKDRSVRDRLGRAVACIAC